VLLCDCVAYTAGSEHDVSEDLDNYFINTASSTSAAVSSCPVTATTDTGRDRLQHCDHSADDTSDVTVVCPSGEVVTTRHYSHKSIVRSCSMPAMCSRSLTGPPRDCRSLDAELQYLSTYAKLQRFASSPMDNSRSSHIAKSPYMSPLLASDEMIRQLCPVHLIVRFAWFWSLRCMLLVVQMLQLMWMQPAVN